VFLLIELLERDPGQLRAERRVYRARAVLINNLRESRVSEQPEATLRVRDELNTSPVNAVEHLAGARDDTLAHAHTARELVLNTVTRPAGVDERVRRQLHRARVALFIVSAAEERDIS
jgi:hypothetical protein